MWFQPPQDRLLEWKRFREYISDLSFEEAVQKTNKLWWSAPMDNQYYSQDLPDDWPDPWNLLVDNCYDDIARGLGMLYTIALSDHYDHDYEFICTRTKSRHKEHNLVMIDDGKYLLNIDLEVRVNNKLALTKRDLITRKTIKELLGEDYE